MRLFSFITSTMCFFLPFHQVDLFLQVLQVVPFLLWDLGDQRSLPFQPSLFDPDGK